jgi:hypothetical protein
MAAEVLAQADIAIDVYDAMPSVGRKFLMAGKGGLNITHAEPAEKFLRQFGPRADEIAGWLGNFGPAALRQWIHGLGIETFVGSSGRVFPHEMKAAPLLRAWLHRLRQSGVRFHVRHRWKGWNGDGGLVFETPSGTSIARAEATILALGGASWPQLGSDGSWATILHREGVDVVPLQPANCGFDVGWSAHLSQRFAGAPLKNIAAAFGGMRRRGECVITATGIEGGLVYALSAPVRDAIATGEPAIVLLDLLPDHAPERVRSVLVQPRGSRSLSSHLASKLGLEGAKAALLRECLPAETFQDATLLAAGIKALPLRLRAARPIAEAISSAGGVSFGELDAHLMLTRLPGIYCAGEMLDWEAPTGGYLLTACLASGRVAGAGARSRLLGRPSPKPTL